MIMYCEYYSNVLEKTYRVKLSKNFIKMNLGACPKSFFIMDSGALTGVKIIKL